MIFNYVTLVLIPCKFDCISSIIFQYVFGIQCEGLMCEIGEELWRIRQLLTCSWLTREWTTRKRSHEKHKLKAKKLSARRHFTTRLTTSPTCKMTREMNSYFFTYTIKAHEIEMRILNWNENFREKILENPLLLPL